MELPKSPPFEPHDEWYSESAHRNSTNFPSSLTFSFFWKFKKFFKMSQVFSFLNMASVKLSTNLQSIIFHFVAWTKCSHSNICSLDILFYFFVIPSWMFFCSMITFCPAILFLRCMICERNVWKSKSFSSMRTKSSLASVFCETNFFTFSPISFQDLNGSCNNTSCSSSCNSLLEKNVS